jgi:nucleotide-binding universal stress UspA family protein
MREQRKRKALYVNRREELYSTALLQKEYAQPKESTRRKLARPGAAAAERPLFKRILVATDFSRASEPAFLRALTLAREYGAHLLVLHACRLEERYVRSYASDRAYDALLLAMQTMANQELDGLVARAASLGVQAEKVLCYGEPAEQIMKIGEARAVDLIIAGTQGNGRQGRRLGSIASRVLAGTRRPVLTIPWRPIRGEDCPPRRPERRRRRTIRRIRERGPEPAARDAGRRA